MGSIARLVNAVEPVTIERRRIVEQIVNQGADHLFAALWKLILLDILLFIKVAEKFVKLSCFFPAGIFQDRHHGGLP